MDLLTGNTLQFYTHCDYQYVKCAQVVFSDAIWWCFIRQCSPNIHPCGGRRQTACIILRIGRVLKLDYFGRVDVVVSIQIARIEEFSVVDVRYKRVETIEVLLFCQRFIAVIPLPKRISHFCDTKRWYENDGFPC